MSKIRRLASKACGIILFCAAGIHLSGALFPVANAQVPATAAETPPSLAAFQAVVDPVVRALVTSGARNVYLGGGSARAILDHIVYGHAIAMRDLDLVIDFPEISIEAVRAIGTKIETLGLRAEAVAPAPRGRTPAPPRAPRASPSSFRGLPRLGRQGAAAPPRPARTQIRASPPSPGRPAARAREGRRTPRKEYPWISISAAPASCCSPPASSC